MPQVRDIVQGRELFYVEEEQTVAEVARRMAALHVGAILVLRGGQIRGVFSERDIMTRVVIGGLDANCTTAAQVMSTTVTTVEETATLEEAMELMQANNCRHLPVTRGSRVVAFLSMRDLMNFELARKTEELQHMRAYIHGVA
jgi:CBS domain-containing protein